MTQRINLYIENLVFSSQTPPYSSTERLARSPSEAPSDEMGQAEPTAPTTAPAYATGPWSEQKRKTDSWWEGGKRKWIRRKEK